MLKRDPVFWWATGIFILALASFAITQNQFWLALGIGSYLLRPTLASLGVGRKHVDERQMSIHYRSGNIAFAVTITTCVILAVMLGARGDHAFEYFAMTIIIGLATKALFNVILVKDPRRAATKILVSAGLFIALFPAMDSFLSGSILAIFMNMIPGLAIAGVGLLSMRYPRPAGVIVLAAAAALLWVILGKGINWAQLGAAAIVGVPLITAGLCLFARDRKHEGAEGMPAT